MTGTPGSDWRRGYGAGKGAGRRFRGQFGPVVGPWRNVRDDLQDALHGALVDAALGREPSGQDLTSLRARAVTHRHDDWSGVALATVALLAREYGDDAARAWLPVMLAERGRFQDATELPPTRPPQGPPPRAQVALVTALSELGRDDEAHALMAELLAASPEMRESFVTTRGEDPVSREFARLVSRAESLRPALPAFFHLPFSGGTSMIVSLKSVLPWGRIVQVQRRFGLLQIEGAQRLTETDVRDLLLVHLHHPFPLELPGRELTYFTVLRDPASQTASGFYKRMTTQGIVPTGDRDTSQTFEQHVDFCLSHGLTNLLARQIVALHPAVQGKYAAEFRGPGAYRAVTSEEDMFWVTATADIAPSDLARMAREVLDERFHLVGTMKHLAASHLAASASTGVPVAATVGHRGRSGQPSSGASTDPVRDRLRDASWVDQELYDDYTTRFEREYADLIAAVYGRDGAPTTTPPEHADEVRTG